ncbi:MAG: hypothetical protein IT542_02360 [Rubellimicrobium sp.]|nr:hypothetical protein [Rubellimicrobium sp.]
MAIRVEHELHARRRGRNIGLLVVLLGFVAVVFGLTIVKLNRQSGAAALEGFDHAVRPGLTAAPEAPAATPEAPEAPEAPAEGAAP